MSTQLIHPDLGIQKATGRFIESEPGWCLWHSQETFHVPHLYRSAWQAWEATKFRHFDRQMPNVAVPVWFEHWGTYGTPPTYGNWGHVVVWVPGRGFLSSPNPSNIERGRSKGLAWKSSLAQVEKDFNCKFVGWSEDISGVKVIDMEEDMDAQDIRNIGGELWGVPVDEQTVKNLTGKSWHDVMYYLLSAFWWQNRTKAEYENRIRAVELSGKLGTLQKENDDLKAKLAVQSNDTTNLNALGVALQWAIKRLGLSK